MIELPLWSLSIVYGVGLTVYLVMAAFHLFHLVRFGLFDAKGKSYTFFFMASTVLIIGITFLLLMRVNWFDTFVLFDQSWFTTIELPFAPPHLNI